MAIRARYLIELSDIFTLHCECNHCHTVVAVPPLKDLTKLLGKCPNPKCAQPWMEPQSGTHLLSVQILAEKIEQLKQATLGCTLTLEVEAPASGQR
jgi:hypothetical protein